VYKTQTQTSSKPVSTVYTTTSYKPETVTVTSASTAYSTKYSTIVTTLTSYATSTKTIPYNSESSTVICYTKPVWVWTHSTSLYSTAETYPTTSITSSVSSLLVRDDVLHHDVELCVEGLLYGVVLRVDVVEVEQHHHQHEDLLDRDYVRLQAVY
ncbi:hypothetical protein LTR32_007610, partial [Rachicladosporium monterosium]